MSIINNVNKGNIAKLSKFFPLVHTIASLSKDSTQVGAVIFDQVGRIVSTGYNGPPRGVRDTPERLSKPLKYFYCSHAEENAIAQSRTNLDNHIIVVSTLFPCTACARMIIQSGITTVISLTDGKPASQKWKEEAKHAKLMFEEAGVNVVCQV